MVRTDKRNFVSSSPSLAKSYRNLNKSLRYFKCGRADPESRSPNSILTKRVTGEIDPIFPRISSVGYCSESLEVHGKT